MLINCKCTRYLLFNECLMTSLIFYLNDPRVVPTVELKCGSPSYG